MTLWRAVAPELRVTRPMGPMTLLYHRRSGITHMVSAPVPEILAVLDDLGAATVAQVEAELAARFDLATEPGEDGQAALAARLDELAAQGLALRVTR